MGIRSTRFEKFNFWQNLKLLNWGKQLHKNWQIIFKDYLSLTYFNSCKAFELSFFMKTSSCENYSSVWKKLSVKTSIIYKLISNAYRLTGISIKILTEMYSRQKLVPPYTANKRKQNTVIFVCDTRYFF